MAIDFPTSPTVGQQVTSGSRTWSWSGSHWENNTITGVQGIQGIQGVQGTQGTQGTQGAQGLQGTQGLQGIQGVQGVQGTQGTQGTQGLQGITGTQGAVGSQGTQGTQGLQGIQGISGASILGTNNTFTGTNAFGTLTTTGNVGVGTTDTTAKFNIGTTDTRIEFGQASATVAYMEVLNAARNASLAFSSYALSHNWLTNTGSGWNSRLFITNAGNVGIGTSTPSVGLEYQNNTPTKTDDKMILQGGYLSGAGGEDYGFYTAYRLLHSNGSSLWTVARIKAVESPSWGGQLIFETNPAPGTAGHTTTERMRILANGNVGIGTASPASKLDTAGTVRATSQTVPSSGTGAELFYDATYAGLRGYNRTGSAYVNLALNDNVYIGGGSSGNVGIGTTSPTTKLHVDQGADSNGITLAYSGRGASRINWDLSGVTNEATTFFHNNGTNRYVMQQWSRDYVSFYSNNTERARIDSAGSVIASVDVRSPIFYDSNDTGYYVNPNASSYIYDLHIDRRLKHSGYSGTRYFTFDVGNASNTKAKLHFSGWFWGNIEISAVSSYNYANRPGIVKKRYAFGGSPAGDQYTNESRIVESMGVTPNGITFGEIFWDSSVSKWAIIVASLDSSANTYQLEVKCFCPDSSSRNQIIDSMTISATYTSDATAYTYANSSYKKLIISDQAGIGAMPAGVKLQVGDYTNPILSRNIISSGGYSASNVRQQNLMTFQATTVSNENPFSDTSGESAKNWHIGIVSDTNYQNTNRFSIIKSGTELAIFTSTGGLTITGALSKGSGSFRIEHPLASKSETHELVHSFIEGPQADLIYRGKVTLVNGAASVNIDTASTMTEGTFEALCREIQCFTTNETGWTAVRGKVAGNILTIEAQDSICTDEISWMVIGERKDKHMLDTEWTDDSGKVIVEPLKPVKETAETRDI